MLAEEEKGVQIASAAEATRPSKVKASRHPKAEENRHFEAGIGSRAHKTEDYNTMSKTNVENATYCNTFEVACIYQRRVSFTNRKQVE